MSREGEGGKLIQMQARCLRSGIQEKCESAKVVIIGAMLELILESVKNSATSASLRGKKGGNRESGGGDYRVIA